MRSTQQGTANQLNRRQILFRDWERYLKSRESPSEALTEAQQRLDGLRERMTALGSCEGKIYHGFVRQELLSACGMAYGALSQAKWGLMRFPRGGIIEGGGGV